MHWQTISENTLSGTRSSSCQELKADLKAQKQNHSPTDTKQKQAFSVDGEQGLVLIRDVYEIDRELQA